MPHYDWTFVIALTATLVMTATAFGILFFAM